MASRIVDQNETLPEFVRRKSLTAHNHATMHTIVNTGQFGTFTMDEPVGSRWRR